MSDSKFSWDRPAKILKKVSEQNLNDLGYGEHPSPPFSHADTLYQRWVRDSDKGTKLYAINFLKFDMTKFGHGIQWSADVHLYPADAGFEVFKLELHIDSDTSIGDVEEFCAKAYDKLGCQPDIHNQ